MDIRLLGVVEGSARKQKFDLGPLKQRFAFAVLALNVNQLVPVDRLVDLTWPIRPPKTAHHAIHVRVSRLRSELARLRMDRDEADIVTHGSAYVLKTSPLNIDVHRFRALIAGARSESDDEVKVTMLRHALDLWRGPALADVAPSDVAARLCHGLNEARMVAIEERIDAELRLGRHNTVIDELTELTADHPHRQRLFGQLMLALYRAGRAADALKVYQQARTTLADEHALEPEARLSKLQLSILRADPELDLPRPRTDRHTVSVRLQNRFEVWSFAGNTSGTQGLAVEVRQLTKRFGDRTVLEDLCFSARQGEVVGVAGASGSGKTTAVRLLSTTLPPTGGDFSIAGIPSSRPAEIRRRIGVLPQDGGYPIHQTGAEYLRYHARLFGVPRAEAGRIATRLLVRLGLTDQASSRISTYTPAMCRRLGLARTLVNSPAVIFLDEPAVGLDPAEQGMLLRLVRDIAAGTGATLVAFVRSLHEIEQVCDSVVLLDQGRIRMSVPTVDTADGVDRLAPFSQAVP